MDEKELRAVIAGHEELIRVTQEELDRVRLELAHLLCPFEVGDKVYIWEGDIGALGEGGVWIITSVIYGERLGYSLLGYVAGSASSKSYSIPFSWRWRKVDPQTT